jgi:hypothetical protein
MLGAEAALRLRGHRPWDVGPLEVEVRPGGRFFVRHPTLGYAHIPGNFTVTLRHGYSFQVTHLANTLRITHPLATYPKSKPKDEIWVFGCSFTHGWSVNDDETYAWLLQERQPQYEVVNYGVGGYGTIHALIQLREEIAAGRIPRVVVVAYAGFHDERNTFLRGRRKDVATGLKLGPVVQPYARLRGDTLMYSMAQVEYREVPLMRVSALVHYLEKKFNYYQDRWLHSHRVSEALILEIAELARVHEFKLVIATIDRSTAAKEMLAFARKHGIHAVDISVDLSLAENTNHPYDGHPSARANREYADRLEPYLRSTVLK